MSKQVYSHPLAELNDSDEDDYNNNFSSIKAKNESVAALVTAGTVLETTASKLIDKPQIPPRLKTKQQQQQQQQSVTTNSSSNKATSDKWNNYSQNQVNENLKALAIEPINIQPQQVRWLYKEDATASKWLIFSGLDSLNLETEYLLSKQVNYAKNRKLIQVLNRLFEVDVVERKCTPIYWEGASLPVMRGTWFHDQSWEPLDEDLSDRIELEHINKFKDYILNKSSKRESINENELNIYSNDNELTEAAAAGSLTNKTNINKFKDYILNKSAKRDSVNENDLSSYSNDSNELTETAGSNSLTNKTQTKTVNEPIYSITYKDQTCYWYSPDDVYISKNKSLLKVLSFGNKKIGTRVNRGYKTNAESEDHSGDITHLVFVVHGIAQKLFEKSIVKNCDDLRKGFEQVRQKFYGDAKKEIRCEFIPVDWRSSLTLDDGIVETITPQTLKVIRNKLNSSALDIMYYTSPLFRNEIMNGLSSELNRLYTLFCDKNPYFKAKNCKVSIVAHSLGSVIIYDILTHNNSIITLSNTYGEDMNQEAKMFSHFAHNNTALVDEYMKSKKRIREIEEQLLENNQNLTLLDFQPDNLFVVGSPLAVFLALRGVRPSGSGQQDHILPKKVCKHLFNLFHPCDAVAYRLEPLVLKHYSSIMPVEVHKASDNKDKHVPYKEMQNKVMNKTADLELSSTSSTPFNFLTKSKKDFNMDGSQTESITDFQTLSNRIQSIFSTSSNNSNVHDAVDLERRLDYVLPTSNFELISALTSHTCYWQSLEVALFLVTQLLDDEN